MRMAEATVAEDALTHSPELEEQQRKRAYDIIKKGFRNSAIPLSNRSVSHRLLPGLWSATVNLLLACLDVKDVIKLLTNRMASLSHEAENAQAEPVTLAGNALARYAKEVGVAGQAIAEAIGDCIPHLEKEGLEDRLPESVLDCAVFLLVNSWGPVHLRRAMVEQVASLLSGSAAPTVFMEPTEQVKRKQEAETASEPESSSRAETASLQIDRREKLIRIFSDYRLSGDGAEWAVAIQKTGPNNIDELHVMKGEAADFNGRSAPLTAIVEALKSVSHEGPKSVVFIETSHDFVLRGMEGSGSEKLAFRHHEEEAIWAEFDALTNGRDIRYKSVTASLSDHLQGVCDMVMKRGAINLV
jgi:hypothetical protein|nr:hypothetical protein [Neorhizobium tomejilense]